MQNEQQALTKLEMLLQRFTQSDEVMYTSFLAAHFKHILLKYGHQSPVSPLVQLCDAVTNRVYLFEPLVQPTIYKQFTYNTILFYLRANELVTLHFGQNEQTAMHKFSTIEGQLAITQLLEQFEQQQIQYYVHMYAPNH